MSEPIFDFGDPARIGRVSTVDTSRVLIDVDDHGLLTRIPVGTLLAIAGRVNGDFFVCLSERVTRTVTETALVDEESVDGEIPVGEKQTDCIRAVLLGTFRSVDGDNQNTFKRGIDSFPQVDKECFVIEAENLQRFMSLLGADLPEEAQLRLGKFSYDRSAVAIADGNRFFQRHAAVLGSTGSGKSWCVALLLERAAKLQFPNLIVLDMHGEYTPLSEAAGEAAPIAKRFRVAGPGDLDDPDEDVLFLPYWLLNREEMLAMLLDRSDQNAPNQASRFTSLIRDLKDESLTDLGKEEVQATFTVDSPIPYQLSDLIDRLKADNMGTKKSPSTGKDIKGDWNDKLTRFISRLEAKVDDRRYGFLFQPPELSFDYDWLSTQVSQLLVADPASPGIKIVDFSEVPPDVLPIVVGVFARILYDIQFWTNEENRTPFSLVCDEAHLYLPTRQDSDSVSLRAVEAFERIAKEGRKYGVSLLVVSQRPSDVSRTILSQCNNFLSLRLTNDADQSVIRKLMPDSMSALTDILPLLDIGEAVILGDAVLLPTRIVLDKPTHRPASATRDFWEEWNARESTPDRIQAAVEALRKQKRD
ncbi:ATP-binding protein [Verrucomicrobiaceae bacterium 227]